MSLKTAAGQGSSSFNRALDRAFSFMKPDKGNIYSRQKKICPVCKSDNSADSSKNQNKCVNCGFDLGKVQVTRV